MTVPAARVTLAYFTIQKVFSFFLKCIHDKIGWKLFTRITKIWKFYINYEIQTDRVRNAWRHSWNSCLNYPTRTQAGFFSCMCSYVLRLCIQVNCCITMMNWIITLTCFIINSAGSRRPARKVVLFPIIFVSYQCDGSFVVRVS